MLRIESEKFLLNFAGIFDDTDSSQIKLSTEFKGLDEWSSMMALSLIAMVDEEYNIKLSGDDIRSSNNVEELLGRINNKLS